MRPPVRSRGTALLLALVMLLISSLGATALLRQAFGTERVAWGARGQLQAQQAAELALRYCEQQLLRSDGAWPVQPLRAGQVTPHWAQASSWTGPGRLAHSVPAAVMVSEQSPFRLLSLPDCLAEEQALADGATVLLVTARGFSPDYHTDAQGRTVAGSVAWMQAWLRLGDGR